MAPRKDLLSFLFGESAELEAAERAGDELKLAGNLERLFEAAEAEQGELQSKKTPLAKALGELGIKDAADDLQLDTEGFVLATDNHERYVDALTVLGSADAMHKLAEMGWVVTKPGDDAMTNEPANYRIRFLDITTVDTEDRDPKAGTYDTSNREEVIKKAQKFASTPMDRDDKLNPVDNDDGKMSKKNVGLGKAKEGEKAEKAIHDSLREGDEKKFPVCPKCHSEVDMPDNDPKSGAVCAQCGYEGPIKWVTQNEWAMMGDDRIRETLLSGDPDRILEFTSTASMGTAMSMGQPFVGMVKKPKPYGKGTKFKTPSQWTVKQPVVKQQVKRKVRSESADPVEQAAHTFLEQENTEDIRPGEEHLSPAERERRDFRERHAEGDPDAIAQAENPPDEPFEPQEGDITTEDHHTFYQYGKLWLQTPQDWEWEQTRRAVQEKMNEDQFWPDIWFISDHGNAHLMKDVWPKPESGAAPAPGEDSPEVQAGWLDHIAGRDKPKGKVPPKASWGFSVSH